jgi:hypothetical protein
MAALCQAGQARKFVPRSTKFLAERIAKETDMEVHGDDIERIVTSQAEESL